MEEGKSAFKILIGKTTAKRPLRRLRPRWENNFGMDLKKIRVGINRRNHENLAQNRDYWRDLANTPLNFRVP